MKFFLDNNLPPQFSKALQALDVESEIVHLRDKFDPSTADEIWLPALGEEGDWVVVSGDRRIARSAKLREAWKASKLTTFFLAGGWTNHPLWEQAWRIVRWWPLIIEQAKRVAPGAVFLVPVSATGRFQTFDR